MPWVVVGPTRDLVDPGQRVRPKDIHGYPCSGQPLSGITLFAPREMNPLWGCRPAPQDPTASGNRSYGYPGGRWYKCTHEFRANPKGGRSWGVRTPSPLASLGC